jgi:hypothetical protein
MPYYVEVYRAMADELTAATGIGVIKGFPSWGQPTLTLPAIALLLESADIVPPARIGGGNCKRQLTWRIIAYGKHEMNLLELLDVIGAWLIGAPAIKVGGAVVGMTPVASGRQVPLSGVQQEEYAFFLLIETII